MELTHTARLRVLPDAAWDAVGDVDELAGLLDGAELRERDGDVWRGTFAIKVGPVTARFDGEVRLAWRDDEARRLVLEVEADEVGGIGEVAATLNVTVTEDGRASVVSILTNLAASGRLAQFGKGLVTDLGDRLLQDLAADLERGVLADAVAVAAQPDPDAERRPVAGWGEAPHPFDDDVAEVEALLGRRARGRFEVVVRHDDGSPLVVRNEPLLRDGTPMPTLYWLVGEPERTWVARIEADGGVRRAELEVDPEELAEAHHRYAEERDAAMPEDHQGPRPGGGIGGTRMGVKCLHAHYAYFLAGGEDPVGQWVADELARVTR